MLKVLFYVATIASVSQAEEGEERSCMARIWDMVNGLPDEVNFAFPEGETQVNTHDRSQFVMTG